MSRAKGLIWMAAIGAAAAATAAGLPWLAGKVPWPVERALAGMLGGAPAGEPCQGQPPFQAGKNLDRLVARIYPLDREDTEVPIRVTVLPGNSVNAFAVLGGQIYIYDGLLQQARSPEELAGVLAHEIEHVRNRHIIQAMAVNLTTLGAVGAGDASAASRLAYLLLTMKFSRTQEEEADLGGLERLRRAQVDAAGFTAFFERAGKSAEPPAILSSHPGSEFRAQRAAQYRGYPVRPALDPNQWKVLVSMCH